MNKIKYLIKFCAEEEYADCLMDGKLFMNTAGYYRYKEKGLGDDREASVSERFQVFKGSGHAVYCMYAVREKDINHGKIKVPSKVINDFGGADGWGVIVDFESFELLLSELDTGGHSLTGGLVQYGAISFNGTKELLLSSRDDNLFIKHPDYEYQKEYRLVVGATLPYCSYERQKDGMQVCFIDEKQPYESKTYSFPHGLQGVAQKFRIADLLDLSGNCCINVIILFAN